MNLTRYRLLALALCLLFTGVAGSTAPPHRAAEVFVAPAFSTAETQWRVYVANRGDNNVTVVDSTSASIIATIPVGELPRDVAISPDGQRAYVANGVSSSISVIDTATNTLATTIHGVGAALNLALTDSGDRLYVTNNVFGGLVTVIDTRTNTIDARVEMPGVQGTAVAISHDKAYVGTQENVVAVLDRATNTVVDVISGVGFVTGLALTPDQRMLYVASGFQGLVSVIDTATNQVVAKLSPGGGFLRDVTVSPDGQRAYVASEGLYVAALDTSTNMVVGSVFIPGRPAAVAVAPNGKYIFVTADLGATLEIVDAVTLTVVASVSLGTPYVNGANPGALPAGLAVSFNRPPVAQAGPDRTVIVGESVEFDGTASSDPDGTINGYQWDFGDGSAAAGRLASHTYTTAGQFIVTLTVTDNNGATGIDTAAVAVQTTAQAIQSLINLVQSLNLARGISNSLDAKLQNALDALNLARSGNREAAINQLVAFVNSVNAQRGKAISEAEADALVGAANSVIAALGSP